MQGIYTGCMITRCHDHKGEDQGFCTVIVFYDIFKRDILIYKIKAIVYRTGLVAR